MGETAAETLTEIASVRDALERDISTLGERMPPKETLVKGAAFGGGGLAVVASLVALVVKTLSHRAEEKALRHEAEVHAEAVADVLARRARERGEETGPATDRDVGEDDGAGGSGIVWAVLALLAGFAAAFAWVRRGRLDQDDFAEADPEAAVEPDLATGAGRPTRPGGTNPKP